MLHDKKCDELDADDFFNDKEMWKNGGQQIEKEKNEKKLVKNNEKYKILWEKYEKLPGRTMLGKERRIIKKK